MGSTHDPAAFAALQKAAREQLWRLGILFWKLHEDQRLVYEQIQASKASRFVLEIARRWGKTYLLCLIAIETCLRKPRQRVVYGAPTLKHLTEFIIPTIEALIEDAPPDCRPKFNVATGHLDFPNGSHVHLFGADDKRKADRGRGPGAVLAIFDEAGFTPILRYVMRSVFRPQTLTTGGRTLLGSTPAEEPDHDFTAIAERAEAVGHYARRTIHDNPRLSPEQIQRFIEDDARDEGMSVEEYMQSDDFRREYMAERVVNKLLIVVPEWEERRAELIREIQRPEYFDGMTMLDMGGADPHALLFGYWHFPMSRFVIEDELLLRNGENTEELAQAAKKKEMQLWGVDRYEGTLKIGREIQGYDNVPDWLKEKIVGEAPEQPYSRWSDNNLQMVRDLLELNGIAFIPTQKMDKVWHVNALRLMIRSGEFVVHPRCTNLDRHLKTTVWENHKRKTYKRKGGEHGDLVDCAVYGGRNVNRQRNPWPKEYRPVSRIHQPSETEKVAKVLLGGTWVGSRILKR